LTLGETVMTLYRKGGQALEQAS